MLNRVIQAAAAMAGAVALSACSVVGQEAAPEPEYTTVSKAEPFEVRAYPELVLVKTSMADGSSNSFRRLFRYISGENGGERKIAMTAPVLQSPGTKIAMTAPVLTTGGEIGRSGSGSEGFASDQNEMSFILTSDFTPETAPEPKDPAVALDVIPARKVAVIRFSGVATPDDFQRNTVKLQAWMDSQGLKASGPAELAQYNPPFTIPSLRRNEVLIPIAE